MVTSGCATARTRRRKPLATQQSVTKPDELSLEKKIPELEKKAPEREYSDSKPVELSFWGQAYHADPGKAREKAKSEALEKMLLSLAGVDIDGKTIDVTRYFKEFSDSGTGEEKGEIVYRKTLTVDTGQLKGLRLRVETSCRQEGDFFNAAAFVFVDKKEAEQAGMRRKLELALSGILEIEGGKKTSVQFPENPGNSMREAIGMLAKKFTSAIVKDDNITRIAVLGIAGDSSNSLREEIISLLFKSEEYQLVERRAALLEQKLSLSGAVDPETGVSPGKILGVDAIIVGQIRKVEEKHGRASVEAYLKMVSVETGEIIWAGVVEGHSTAPLSN